MTDSVLLCTLPASERETLRQLYGYRLLQELDVPVSIPTARAAHKKSKGAYAAGDIILADQTCAILLFLRRHLGTYDVVTWTYPEIQKYRTGSDSAS